MSAIERIISHRHTPRNRWSKIPQACSLAGLYRNAEAKEGLPAKKENKLNHQPPIYSKKQKVKVVLSLYMPWRHTEGVHIKLWSYLTLAPDGVFSLRHQPLYTSKREPAVPNEDHAACRIVTTANVLWGTMFQTSNMDKKLQHSRHQA